MGPRTSHWLVLRGPRAGRLWLLMLGIWVVGCWLGRPWVVGSRLVLLGPWVVGSRLVLLGPWVMGSRLVLLRCRLGRPWVMGCRFVLLSPRVDL